jgi:hypothetical protein
MFVVRVILIVYSGLAVEISVLCFVTACVAGVEMAYVCLLASFLHAAVVTGHATEAPAAALLVSMV